MESTLVGNRLAEVLVHGDELEALHLLAELVHAGRRHLDVGKGALARGVLPEAEAEAVDDVGHALRLGADHDAEDLVAVVRGLGGRGLRDGRRGDGQQGGKGGERLHLD